MLPVRMLCSLTRLIELIVSIKVYKVIILKILS